MPSPDVELLVIANKLSAPGHMTPKQREKIANDIRAIVVRLTK